MSGIITSDKLPDMQKSTTGFYKKGIEKVGVRNIISRLPIQMKDGSVQTVTASISSYCSLDANTKGINMSRISRTINKVLSEESSNNGFRDLERFVTELVEAHGSPDVYIKAKATMVIDWKAPMTQEYSQQPFDIVIESQFRDGEYKTFLTVKSCEMSLCPCSKTMSLLVNNVTDEEMAVIESLPESLKEKVKMAGFGAHNQRSEIAVKVELSKDKSNILWIEDIKHLVIEKSSSCPTFSVLKRPDEKMVTECSYVGGYFDDEKKFNRVEGTGPKFVEDIARDVASVLDKELDKTINDYCIVVNNQESIHSQDILATSVLTAGRKLK